MKPLFYLLPALLLCYIACRERVTDEAPEVDIAAQQRYFPLQIGQQLTYRIDSVLYDFAPGGGISVDSFSSFVRETVRDTFRDPSGQLRFTIERYTRRSDTLPWILARIWSAELHPRQAVRTEENLRFLRMVFPMDRRSEWDGNLWIDANREITVLGERIRPFVNWNYEVDSIDIPRRVGAFQFDSTLVITEVDESNIIERRLSRCVYAKNIGLAYKEQWILDSQYCNQLPPPADCEIRPWELKAEKGYRYRQTLIEWQ